MLLHGVQYTITSVDRWRFGLAFWLSQHSCGQMRQNYKYIYDFAYSDQLLYFLGTVVVTDGANFDI